MEKIYIISQVNYTHTYKIGNFLNVLQVKHFLKAWKVI